MTRLKAHPTVMTPLLFLAILVVLTFTSWRILTKAIGPGGGLDFHPYWYQGHHLRQGTNPYDAFFTGKLPATPVHYLDGVTAEAPPIGQPGLLHMPTNLAPLGLLLFTFSFLSWPLAKIIWLSFNLALMLVTPWLALRWPAELPPLTTNQKLLICLIFYALTGTRVTVWLGQTTLLICILLVGTLLALKKNRFIAGILFGFALSKYSLALPLLLFLLYKKEFRVIATGAAVQVAALLLLSLLSGDTPAHLAYDYLLMYQRLSGSEAELGIHLLRWFPAGGLWLVGGLSLFVAAILGYWSWQYDSRLKEMGSQLNAIVDLNLVVIFACWTLVIGYHGLYDTIIVIWFINLAIYGLTRPEPYHLSALWQALLLLSLAAATVVLSLPGEILGVFLSPEATRLWLRAVDVSITGAITLLLIVALGLLFRIHQPEELKAALAPS